MNEQMVRSESSPCHSRAGTVCPFHFCLANWSQEEEEENAVYKFKPWSESWFILEGAQQVWLWESTKKKNWLKRQRGTGAEESRDFSKYFTKPP